jgi:hypothetical protein
MEGIVAYLKLNPGIVSGYQSYYIQMWKRQEVDAIQEDRGGKIGVSYHAVQTQSRPLQRSQRAPLRWSSVSCYF